MAQEQNNYVLTSFYKHMFQIHGHEKKVKKGAVSRKSFFG